MRFSTSLNPNFKLCHVLDARFVEARLDALPNRFRGSRNRESRNSYRCCENVEALLYLKGVDAAIVNSDALEQFKALVPNIRQRITYILSLFPSELHIFVRPEIKSLNDLKGKKVNFNTAAPRPPIRVR